MNHAPGPLGSNALEGKTRDGEPLPTARIACALLGLALQAGDCQALLRRDLQTGDMLLDVESRAYGRLLRISAVHLRGEEPHV